MHEALKAGHPVSFVRHPTIATGLGPPNAGTKMDIWVCMCTISLKKRNSLIRNTGKPLLVEAMVNDGIMLNPNHFRYKLFSGRIKRKINVTRKKSRYKALGYKSPPSRLKYNFIKFFQNMP